MGNWGGTPYDDLVSCFEHVEKTMPFVDINRAVAAGGSYGGYMANWIAGHPLGKRFKTIINHDGVFSTSSMLATDLPTMFLEDLGGPPGGENRDLWDRYDPSRFTGNWSTPMLIIHSDNDFRCPIVEGLAAYNVCQLRGIPSRFLNFPDENHFVLKRENSLKWYKTVLGWANKWAGVKGKIELEPPVTEHKLKTPKSLVVIRRDRW
jgi:dipeptidyl aminopeptidase/acylaminoacyl peptidase